METFQESVGWVACCLNILYFIGPIIPYIRVLKGNLYFEETPGFFVTSCYINCFVWYIFGDMSFNDQVQYSFLISAYICSAFMTVYLFYEIKKFTMDAILNILILIVGTASCYRGLAYFVNDDRIVGKIGIVTAFLMYITPIQIIYRVLKMKNYIIIPIFSNFAYLFACILWIVYGILIEDFIIVFTHSVGGVLSLIQISIFFIFRKKYPTIGEKEFSSTIDLETTGNEENKKEESSNKMKEESRIQNEEKPVKIACKVDN